MSLLIVDDEEISRFNAQYLDRAGPTNVIAFPMREGQFSHITPELLGDVVISAETADREAQHAGLSFMARFDRLLVHGILHLFGFDHAESDRDAKIMVQKEKELLAKVEEMG